MCAAGALQLWRKAAIFNVLAIVDVSKEIYKVPSFYVIQLTHHILKEKVGTDVHPF